MGKARLQAISNSQEPNIGNLNPNHAQEDLMARIYKKATQSTQQQMSVYRRMRKLNKKIAKIRRRDYIKAKRQLFGYWFYWFKEGKIGPDTDDNEPQLLAARYMQNKHKMEHLLDHVR